MNLHPLRFVTVETRLVEFNLGRRIEWLDEHTGNRRLLSPCVVFVVVSLLIAGCRDGNSTSRPAATPPETRSHAATGSPWRPEVDHVESARGLLRLQRWEAATDAAYKALLQDPDNADATLIASEAEGAQGNHAAAAALAGSIDIRGRLGKRAVEIQYQQLVKLKRSSAAADVIIRALEVMPTESGWRHQAWRLLGRVGRREEASRQAVALCREGKATTAELMSAVFDEPFLSLGEAICRFLEEANRRVTMGRVISIRNWASRGGSLLNKISPPRSISLPPNSQAEFESTAACALYGRLLAETQRFEEFPEWQAR